VLTAEARLDQFIEKFAPPVAARARAALARMRQRVPGAVQLVYDNYNALGIGFGANEKLSGIVFSIAVYPRWVSLFFARGRELDDPEHLLKGSGNTVRHIVLKEMSLFDEPAVEALIAQALARASPPIDPAGEGRLVIKSVSARQRPRRLEG